MKNKVYLFIIMVATGLVFLSVFVFMNLPSLLLDGAPQTSSGYYLPCWYGDSGSDGKGTNKNTFAAFYDVRIRTIHKKRDKIGFSLTADKTMGWLTYTDPQGGASGIGMGIAAFCPQGLDKSKDLFEGDMHWKAAPPRDYAIVSQRNPHYWPIRNFVNRVNYFISFPCWYGAKGSDGKGADQHSFAGEFIAGPISEIPTKTEVLASWPSESRNEFCRSKKALAREDAYSKTAPEADYVKIE